jgi:hypothetical protein
MLEELPEGVWETGGDRTPAVRRYTVHDPVEARVRVLPVQYRGEVLAQCLVTHGRG